MDAGSIPTAYLRFEEASKPVLKPITKFGGKPFGLPQALWPNSRKTGAPLAFVAQILLEESIFGLKEHRMAYVFFNTDATASTWNHDSGESAVIILGLDQLVSGPAEGPGIYRVVLGERKFLFRQKLNVPCEYGVATRKGTEVSLTALDKLLEAEDEKADSLIEKMDVSKIGGTPIFIQSDQPPVEVSDRLLLQLCHGDFPFHLNLGDAGTFYVFANQDCSAGYAFWECY